MNNGPFTKRALILGAGQDASFLADILLGKSEYEQVHLLHRRSSVDNLWRIAHIRDKLKLHRGDLADPSSIREAILAAQPHEIYGLADQDDANWSGDIPAYSMDITADSVCRTLEIIRRMCPETKYFHPCSALMFGDAPPPQNESTPFNPHSPFACAKIAAYHLCRMYRQVYGLHVCVGIMFNHDSPARSADYVLHKICKAAVRIAAGEQKYLVLGRLGARIDIGYARDYMEAAWAMLQHPRPDDYVIGTGVAWTIATMTRAAFELAGVQGFEEHITINAGILRPGPQPTLIADSRKAREAFGFRPKTSVHDLIAMLVEHEEHCFAAR